MRRFGFVALAAMMVSIFPALAEVKQGRPNVPEFRPAFKNQTRAPEIRERVRLNVEVIAKGLKHPWGVEVLPNGDYLVTERVGRLVRIRKNGAKSRVRGTPKVVAERQGGLLDVALAEDFRTSGRIYLTYAKRQGLRGLATAVAYATLREDPDRLTGLRDIFIQTPASRSPIHYGSRVVLDGPHAYVTLGEHSSKEERVLAQDLRTTYGKVVRLTLEGGIPKGNPFRGQKDAMGEIWSYGHRNPQGADIHPDTGDLWTLEHGPAGGDELNRITKGANYGWPIVSYGENYNGTPIGTGRSSAPGLKEPQYYWDPVIAPSGFAFYDGIMFDWHGDVIAGSLNPGGIVRLKLKGNRVVGEARYLRKLGRIRDVEIDHDGALLLLIDDPDGSLVRVTPG